MRQIVLWEENFSRMGVWELNVERLGSFYLMNLRVLAPRS